MYKEKIQVLVNTIVKSNGEYMHDDLLEIEGIISKMADYVDLVIYMEAKLQIARFRLEADDYRYIVEEQDRARKLTHNVCISNMKVLNKLCEAYRTEKIFTDVEINMHRTDIANQIIKVIVDEYFESRKK